jgi:hypothetical protein
LSCLGQVAVLIILMGSLLLTGYAGLFLGPLFSIPLLLLIPPATIDKVVSAVGIRRSTATAIVVASWATALIAMIALGWSSLWAGD